MNSRAVEVDLVGADPQLGTTQQDAPSLEAQDEHAQGDYAKDHCERNGLDQECGECQAQPPDRSDQAHGHGSPG
ncbi:hypothetical protein DDE18_14185 [Nocardioides gansuensis]|uniref:Uncharacterized protein n=1 Tax=Nocardioides gansuensis TaxID=2138300 RepID=A0A2T8F830_9ACTN|nr:hypothetical protein DDE18_14185 [Nocardioides gansuensis]